VRLSKGKNWDQNRGQTGRWCPGIIAEGLTGGVGLSAVLETGPNRCLGVRGALELREKKRQRCQPHESDAGAMWDYTAVTADSKLAVRLVVGKQMDVLPTFCTAFTPHCDDLIVPLSIVLSLSCLYLVYEPKIGARGGWPTCQHNDRLGNSSENWHWNETLEQGT
jgi:hypothetical protein